MEYDGYSSVGQLNGPNVFAENINESKVSRWPCHIHSSADCYMSYVRGIQYHIIPIKNGTCSSYALREYNRPPLCLSITNGVQATNEFWEPLTVRPMQMPMICTFDKCSRRYDKEFVKRLFKTVFCSLAENGEYFSKKNNSAHDMIHRHVVTDGFDEIVLCNKHLLLQYAPIAMGSTTLSTGARAIASSTTTSMAMTLRESKNTASRTNADLMRRYRYKTLVWEREILKALFPRNDQRVPLETRTWLVALTANCEERQNAKRARVST